MTIEPFSKHCKTRYNFHSKPEPSTYQTPVPLGPKDECRPDSGTLWSSQIFRLGDSDTSEGKRCPRVNDEFLGKGLLCRPLVRPTRPGASDWPRPRGVLDGGGSG